MKVVLQSAAGILLASAVMGLVVAGVQYPAVYVAVKEVGERVGFTLSLVVGFLAVLLFTVNLWSLFDSILTNEEVPTALKEQAHRVMKVTALIAILVLVYFALQAGVALLDALSQAQNPEFYDGRLSR